MRASADLTPIKINAVIQRGVNDHTAIDLVRALSRHRSHRPLHRVHGRRQSQRLARGSGGAFEGAGRAHRRALAAARRVEREYRGEVAKRYAFADGQGEVGFISSVTQPFCGDCSRARLSSDGVVYTCLFATQGTSVRDALRSGASDEQLLEMLRDIWLARTDRYSEIRSRVRQSRRAGEPAQGRDVLHRRLMAWRGQHSPDASGRRQPPDDGRCRAQGSHAPRRRRRGARQHAAPMWPRALRKSGHRTKKGPVFDTAIVAGVMAAKKTHELIPFCHPLAWTTARSRSRTRRGGEHRHPLPRVRPPSHRRGDGSADRRGGGGADDL